MPSGVLLRRKLKIYQRLDDQIRQSYLDAKITHKGWQVFTGLGMTR